MYYLNKIKPKSIDRAHVQQFTKSHLNKQIKFINLPKVHIVFIYLLIDGF